MTGRLLTVAALTALSLGLVACSEPAQTTKAAYSKAEKPQWTGAANPFAAPGWQAGDEDSWRRQLQTRARAQNEYTRTGN